MFILAVKYILHWNKQNYKQTNLDKNWQKNKQRLKQATQTEQTFRSGGHHFFEKGTPFITKTEPQNEKSEL